MFTIADEQNYQDRVYERPMVLRTPNVRNIKLNTEAIGLYRKELEMSKALGTTKRHDRKSDLLMIDKNYFHRVF